MPYNPIDLSYIAGLIDGEGYIGLVKHLEKRRTKTIKNRMTYYYRPTICIAMCEREGIDFIDNLFEGNIWLQQRIEPQKDLWQWSAKGQQRVEEILKVILPYLKVKTEQAKLVLDFIKIRENKNNHKIKWGTSSYGRKEDEIYKKIRLLNKRGK